VFSFHNPDIGGWHQYNAEILGDMINTYSSFFKQNYSYCSDSNGYWRFRRLEDVLQVASDEKLQALTHREWWVPTPMSPRDRISRRINGRYNYMQNTYGEVLEYAGRKKITASIIGSERD